MRAFCDIELRVVAMMRDQVMVPGDADLAVGAAAQLARHDQLKTRVMSAAERHHLQVEHQLGVLFERGRECRGDDPAVRRILRALRFACLDALFDFADRIQVLAELGRCRRSERSRQRPRLLPSPNRGCCPVLADAGEPLVGGAAVAEEAFENYARMILGHVGRGLVAPGDGVDVEAVARIAGALRRPGRPSSRSRGAACLCPGAWAAIWSAVVASFTSTPGRVRS